MPDKGRRMFVTREKQTRERKRVSKREHNICNFVSERKTLVKLVFHYGKFWHYLSFSIFFFFWDFWEIFQLTFKRVVNQSERFTCWKKKLQCLLVSSQTILRNSERLKVWVSPSLQTKFFFMEYHLNHLSFYKYFESVKVIPTDIV